MFASIPIIDRRIFEFLESLEAACLQNDRDISVEALGRSKGSVRDCLSSMPVG